MSKFDMLIILLLFGAIFLRSRGSEMCVRTKSWDMAALSGILSWGVYITAVILFLDKFTYVFSFLH